MSASKIEWTEQTWNPIVGCSLESPGCTNCYAMKLAGRLALMGTAAHYRGTTQKTKAGFVWSGTINVAPDSILLAPMKRRKPTTYFVNSMSDLFHPDVPDDVIDRVFAVMALCPQHTFQVLTKRAARMRAYMSDPKLPIRLAMQCFDMNRIGQIKFSVMFAALGDRERDEDPEFVPMSLANVWLGVSVEDQTRADERIPDLLATPAAVRFLSCEPLLGPVDLTWIEFPNEHGKLELWDALSVGDDPTDDWNCSTACIDWVIVGGESGPGARPMASEWAQSIVDQCRAASVPVFVTQLSSGGSKAIKDIEAFPEGLRVRETPNAR